MVAKENALSVRATVKRSLYDSLNLRPTQSNGGVTDVVAKTPKSQRRTKSSVKAG
jgi:hypothetical protein